MTMNISTLLEALEIGENCEVEFKLAAGGLSNDIWETVSAFANTDGGHIVLGIGQKDESFKIVGLTNPDNLLKKFWDLHNNNQKLSSPVCQEGNVQVREFNLNRVIIIEVPRAGRTVRPVFINRDLLGSTFKRNYEGDYRCTKEEVQQMLRDASSESQDAKILNGFDIEDLDAETFKAFRQRFTSRDPDHPSHALKDLAFLRTIGGWTRERTTGKEGLTLAGLLMFGREESLLEALPHHQLDYQEQTSDNPEQRWSYRLTIDGKWQPNLFNFYFKVYNRLISDLSVPFQLDRDAIRREETHVHEALREALVNTLVHADHLSTRPIKIVKAENFFNFNNPGRLRVPVQQLYEQGGVSDPRNPALHSMFQRLGLGERAGSGFQKIFRAWREQQWLKPLISEKHDIDMTYVIMPMISLIPNEIETELKEVVGDGYHALTEIDRMALVLAHQFEEINNSTIQTYRSEHPRDIGECLRKLVERGWLKQYGKGRGTYYMLPARNTIKVFPLLEADGGDEGRQAPEIVSINSEHNHLNSEHNHLNSEHKDLSHEVYQMLLDLAEPIRGKRRAARFDVENTILRLCEGRYLSLRLIAELIGRNFETIRVHYVNKLVDRRLLESKYPEQPNHPQQAYTTALKQGQLELQL